MPRRGKKSSQLQQPRKKYKIARTKTPKKKNQNKKPKTNAGRKRRYFRVGLQIEKWRTVFHYCANNWQDRFIRVFQLWKFTSQMKTVDKPVSRLKSKQGNYKNRLSERAKINSSKKEGAWRKSMIGRVWQRGTENKSRETKIEQIRTRSIVAIGLGLRNIGAAAFLPGFSFVVFRNLTDF